MIWYRLKHDLIRDGWLTVRQCENVSVTQWTHSELTAAVHQRYLSNDATRRQLHNFLATYWLGSAESSDPQNRQSSAMNGCGDSSNSKTSVFPVVYDADQPLMFDCQLDLGKPRYFL